MHLQWPIFTALASALTITVNVDDHLSLFEFDARRSNAEIHSDAAAFCRARSVAPVDACATQLLSRARSGVLFALPIEVGGATRDFPYARGDTVEGWIDRVVQQLRDEEGFAAADASRARPQLAAAVRQRLVEHRQTAAAAAMDGGGAASDGGDDATVAAAAAAAPLLAGARPRIFVYTLPPRLVDEVAARRDDMYRTEWALWRRVLRSPSRTLDPAAADLFYVPILGASRFRNKVDWPAYVTHVHDVLRFVREAHPWWNRTRGADHVWMWGHDLGGAFAPVAVRRSIWLTVFNDVAPIEQDLIAVVDAHAGRPFHDCAFDPHRDVVIPPYLHSAAAAKRLYRAALRSAAAPDAPLAAARRTTLLFFRGSIFAAHPFYSRGVRQALWARFSAEPSGSGASDEPMQQQEGGSSPRAEEIRIERHHAAPALYLAELERSVFCACPAGWQLWSPRAYAAIMAGCIPIFFSLADAAMPWEAARGQRMGAGAAAVDGKGKGKGGYALDYAAFSLTMTLGDVATIETTLRSIPAARVREMQRALRAVALRFSYQDAAFGGADAANLAILALADRYSAVSTQVRRRSVAGVQSSFGE